MATKLWQPSSRTKSLRHIPVIMISGVDELDSVSVHRAGRDRLPAQAVQSRRSSPPASAHRMADKRLHDLEVAHAAAQAELLETIERQKEELSRFPSPQVAALVCHGGG